MPNQKGRSEGIRMQEHTEPSQDLLSGQRRAQKLQEEREKLAGDTAARIALLDQRIDLLALQRLR